MTEGGQGAFVLASHDHRNHAGLLIGNFGCPVVVC
jgi:hypothetical protein